MEETLVSTSTIVWLAFAIGALFGSFGLYVASAASFIMGVLHLPETAFGWLFVPMIGIGLAWASIMGNPYVMLAGCIPPERTGVYMGIFNMFIVLPMIIQIFTLPLYYRSLLGGNPENVIRLAGGLMLCGAVALAAPAFPAPADAAPDAAAPAE